MSLAAKRADLLRRQILGCTSCSLHLFCSSPTPPAIPDSPVTPELLIIGEAPGAAEERAQEPFVGPAGRLVFKWLKMDLGLHRSQIWIGNRASCRPTVANKGKANRQPSKEECWSCRDHLANLINLYAGAGGRWMLLLGATALQGIVEGAKITQWASRPFVIKHRQAGLLNVMATLHPAAALRDPRNEVTIRESLQRLANLKRGGQWPEECVVCKGDVARYDGMGVPWCAEHQVYGRREMWVPMVRAEQRKMVV